MNKPAVLRGEKGPRTLIEAKRVAGSATCKESQTVLFVYSVYSWKQREFDLVCWKPASEDLSHWSIIFILSSSVLYFSLRIWTFMCRQQRHCSVTSRLQHAVVHRGVSGLLSFCFCHCKTSWNFETYKLVPVQFWYSTIKRFREEEEEERKLITEQTESEARLSIVPRTHISFKRFNLSKFATG